MDPQPLKSQAVFVGKFIVAHLVSYFAAAMLGFYLVTGDLYTENTSPLKGFLATPGEPEAWSQVLVKMFPIQLLRGFLLGIVFYSIFKNLKRWGRKRRFLAIIGFYFIAGFLASPAIAPGTLEGMLYMQTQFAPTVHQRFFLVMLIQAALLAFIMAQWMKKNPPAEDEDLNHS